ncbi:MAG: deoxyribonuclease IV [Ignavibacteriales bacterium]|nr:deoxyribonuclease IV [Ignavibacteriales bacterium]
MKGRLLGAHVSTAGGADKAIDRADEHGFTAMQIFTKNNNRWDAKPITDELAERFREKFADSSLRFSMAHSSYLINLCSENKETLAKSRRSLVEELERCDKLGVPHLNFHPGSHGGRGIDAGLRLVADSINWAHERAPDLDVTSCLEFTAGHGTALGYRFEHLARIIDKVEDNQRMTFCVDTAHLCGAGHNLAHSLGYEKTIEEMDEVVGLKRLVAVHANDSKMEVGSRRDRHEHIGKGYIGVEGFRRLMNDKRLWDVPFVLETPKGEEMKEDDENIAALLKLVK